MAGSTLLRALLQVGYVSHLSSWVQYFRVGNASRVFSEIRDYVEMKVRNLLTRRKQRHK
jgi:group II intron maturase